MRMKTGKFVRDFLMMLFSNGIVLLASIYSGLLVPKILGLTHYGLYKLFLLYLGYTALLHFGFVDGVLLFHSGKDYKQLSKEQFRTDVRFYIGTQVAVALIVFVVAVLYMEREYRDIFILLGIDLVLVNLTTYYQCISQGILRFKELSVRKVLQAVLKTLCVLVLCFVKWYAPGYVITANLYICSIIAIDGILLLWYVFSYRELTFGKAQRLREALPRLKGYYRLGISLTIAYQVANLILNFDRQFVSMFFVTEVFAAYSFAYTLVGLVTTVTEAFAMVLFPNLKRKNEQDMIALFSDAMALVSVVVSAFLLCFYPLKAFILWFLPDYVLSVSYLRVIFPSILFTGCINTILFSYYKAMNKSHVYFVVSCEILVLSFLLNVTALKLFATPESISFASMIALLCWYLLGERFFIKNYGIAWKKNLLYLLIMVFAYYFETFLISDEAMGMLFYAVVYGGCTAAFYRETIKKRLTRKH